jgi:hypothetical protein
MVEAYSRATYKMLSNIAEELGLLARSVRRPGAREALELASTILEETAEKVLRGTLLRDDIERLDSLVTLLRLHGAPYTLLLKAKKLLGGLVPYRREAPYSVEGGIIVLI